MALLDDLKRQAEIRRQEEKRNEAERNRNLRVNPASREEAHWLADVLNREGRSLGTNVTFDGNNRLVLHWRGS